MSEFTEKVMKKIEAEEGRRYDVYPCTSGKMTTGIGFNIEDVPIPDEVLRFIDIENKKRIKLLLNGEKIDKHFLTDAAIDFWFKLNLSHITNILNRHSWFPHIPEFAKLVVIDMCYQMGVAGALEFKNMITSIVYKDYNKAADDLLDSKYARQTPERANRNAEILRSGKI